MAETARRELGAAVLGAVGAGALALIAGGQPWAQVTAEREAPLPPVSGVLTGAEAAPLVPAAGLVLLAAAVALLAVRGAGRVVVGLLMAVAGGRAGLVGPARAHRRAGPRLGRRCPAVGRGRAAVTVDVVAGLAGARAWSPALLGVARRPARRAARARPGRPWAGATSARDGGRRRRPPRAAAPAGDRRGPRPGRLEGAGPRGRPDRGPRRARPPA